MPLETIEPLVLSIDSIPLVSINCTAQLFEVRTKTLEKNDQF